MASLRSSIPVFLHSRVSPFQCSSIPHIMFHPQVVRSENEKHPISLFASSAIEWCTCMKSWKLFKARLKVIIPLNPLAPLTCVSLNFPEFCLSRPHFTALATQHWNESSRQKMYFKMARKIIYLHSKYEYRYFLF